MQRTWGRFWNTSAVVPGAEGCLTDVSGAVSIMISFCFNYVLRPEVQKILSCLFSQRCKYQLLPCHTLTPLPLSLRLPTFVILQVLTCRFFRRICCPKWIFSCFGVAQHPDSPFAWAVRGSVQQDALFCKGREPEGSRGGWAVLQRRPGEAFLWPERNRPWQLWRCILCTAGTFPSCSYKIHNNQWYNFVF